MNFYDHAIEQWEFNRQLTAKLLKEISEQPDPQAILEWAPGEGRAHIGWQILHLALTEELFAKNRLVYPAKELCWPELIPLYQKGSTPGKNVPELSKIQEILKITRENVIETAKTFTEDDLSMIPEPLKERGWDVKTTLNIISWHEPHHQGQAHITFNLWKANQ